MDHSPSPLRRALPGLLALTLCTFVALTSQVFPVGLLPLIVDAFATNESGAGLLVTAYASMVALLSVPLALATARLPRKALLLSTLACYGASNVLIMLAPSLGFFVAGRLLGGVAHAVFFSVCIGYAARLVPSRLTGQALAIASAGVSAGLIVGVPLGVWLGTAFGWRSAYGALIGCTLIAVVLVMAVLPPVPTAATTSGGYRGKRRLFGIVIASNTLTYLGHYLLFTYVTVMLLGAGASPASIAPLLLLFAALGLAVLLLVSRHFDSHLHVSAIGIVAIMTVGATGVALAYPAITATVIAAAVWNMGFGPTPSLFQTAAVRTGVTSPDLAGAWTNATCNVGIAIGAAAGGVILDAAGITAVAWTGAGLLAVALAVVLAAPRAFISHRQTEADDFGR